MGWLVYFFSPKSQKGGKIEVNMIPLSYYCPYVLIHILQDVKKASLRNTFLNFSKFDFDFSVS